jgi:two-component system CheB/CheR fusion protein
MPPDARRPKPTLRSKPAPARRSRARVAPGRALRRRDRLRRRVGGRLEAFSQLLPGDAGGAGTGDRLVQHLAPQHESALPALLSARTHLQVVQAAEGMRVERNRVYVIPPNVQMSIADDTLHLVARPSDRTQYTPIDYFLHSLAAAAQDRAVGVILSGTASDGTAGLRAIKAGGGITIAQDPATARYDGMPRAAIAGGFVDLILPPAEIAAELASIARHPLKQAAKPAAHPDSRRHETAVATEPHMDQVFGLLRASSGVDFRRYKRPTIDRRLQRRMVLHKVSRIEEYVRVLREIPTEVQALYNDILIHVTRFFRDGEAFTALASLVLPRIAEGQSLDQPIRIWVPGCATGEEAYSIAIVTLEYLAEIERPCRVQVFATDISDPAIEHARTGVYHESIAADVTPERLRRFFTKIDGGYRVNKAVRDACIFARQDLTRDPPFSKLDLIVCRNVLIYLGSELQQKVMSVFHYALKPTGALLLGNAETIGSSSDLFAPADRKHRIYSKKMGANGDVELKIGHEVPDSQLRAPEAAVVRP